MLGYFAKVGSPPASGRSDFHSASNGTIASSSAVIITVQPACIVSIARRSVAVLAVPFRISSVCTAPLCPSSADFPNAHAVCFP